jgi:Protein of unknown function (DUF2934)
MLKYKKKSDGRGKRRKDFWRAIRRRRDIMNVQEEIATVAYELYETRCCVRGHDLDDWLDAERIVLSRHAGQDFEEPEEDDVFETSVAGARNGIRTPLTAPDGETEEIYLNEELS